MSTDSQIEAIPNVLAERRKFLRLEVLALCGIFVASILGPAFGPWTSSVGSSLSPGYAVYAAVSHLSRLSVFLFVMYASGDPMSLFGIRKIRWASDLIPFVVALIGLLCVWIAFFAVHAGEATQALDAMRKSGAMPPFPLTPIWLLVITSICAGVFYEVAFRGYLIPRFEELFGSVWLAVVAQALFSGLVFSGTGAYGMILQVVIGLVMGAIFVKWRTVWPLAASHAILYFVIVSSPMFFWSHLM